jgi:endoglucanase
MAERLRRVGIGRAQGFALNVSNFNRTTDETAYGHAISRTVGRAHFVIDTSRNGRGPTSERAWCNPPGRALGEPPTAAPRGGGWALDALLWIKAPGESDGRCNGGPPAGRWWRDYALGLAARSAG